jgi:hypothetical protein
MYQSYAGVLSHPDSFKVNNLISMVAQTSLTALAGEWAGRPMGSVLICDVFALMKS